MPICRDHLECQDCFCACEVGLSGIDGSYMYTAAKSVPLETQSKFLCFARYLKCILSFPTRRHGEGGCTSVALCLCRYDLAAVINSM
jgi:hypothetical protein